MKTVGVKLEVPLGRIADLICEGFEGGIGYWARIEDYTEAKERVNPWGEGEKVSKYISLPLSAGGAVIFSVVEPVENGDPPDKTYQLDWLAVLRGLSVFYQEAPKHFANWVSHQDDAETGDVFIQLCLFGKVVFG